MTSDAQILAPRGAGDEGVDPLRTLWFQVGVFLLAFLLMLALPRGAGRRAAEQPAAAETVPALAEGIVTQ